MIEEEKQLETTQNSAETAIDAIPVTEATAEAELSDTRIDNLANGADSAAGEAQPAIDHQAALMELETELGAIKSQLEERTSQYMRIAADFDNFRKRTQREREDLEQQVKISTINELLPVVDNFERARSQIKPQTEQENTIHKSYQSVYKQLVDCLKRIGVAPMRAEGKEFDPNLHEAVMRQPTHDFPEGTVMEELQRGYLLGERVLRHALVKVAAAPEDESPAAESANSEGAEG